jgi:hypothetical protein
LGSGILKILFPHQFLHDNVFYFVIFVGDSQQPVGGALLGISVVDYASVVNYASDGFSWILIDLSGMCWCQVIL